MVLSKDQWDHGRQFKVKDGSAEFESDLAIVRRSGLRNVPQVTIGADKLSGAAGERHDRGDKPVSSAGTDLIVREARKASPKKPLVVIVGGPLCTVASAYLTDPRSPIAWS